MKKYWKKKNNFRNKKVCGKHNDNNNDKVRIGKGTGIWRENQEREWEIGLK